MSKQSKSRPDKGSSHHLTDDPRQAVESGEPRIAGRVPAHPTKPSKKPKGASETSAGGGDTDEHYESGRQDALR